MKQITSDQIQERFNSLPQGLKNAITSPEVNVAIERVAEENGLRVDQLGELVDLTGLVMLGFVPSRDFVSELCTEAEIGEIQARKIAEDVNRRVLGKIRTLLQEAEMLNSQNETGVLNPEEQGMISTENSYAIPGGAKPSHITDLEKAGGFTIEHDMGNREAGLGSEDLRAMPMRDKWSPFGQTIVPTPSKPTVEASPVITKTIEVQQPIPKSNNIPTEPPRQTPIIIKTTEAKESFIKEPIISKPAVPVVEEPIQKITEVIEQKVETKIKPEVEVKEEVVVSTVPDNLPVEPAVTKTEEKLPIKEAASSAQATETKVEMKVEKTVPKATEELTAPTEPQGNSLAETIINLRRIKDTTPKPQTEQTPTIEQPTKSDSNTIKEQTPPPQPAPELIVPEKIKLNPGIPKPIEQQRPRSSDPYREPTN